MDFREDEYGERMRAAIGDRADWRRSLMLPLLVWLVVVGLIIAGVVSLSGCAENRYLTKEEDDELRAQCEPQPQGCAVMPMHEWLQIEQILKRLSGQST